MKNSLFILLSIVAVAASCKRKNICAAHASFFVSNEAQLEEMFAIEKKETKDSLFTSATTDEPKIEASPEGTDTTEVALNPNLPKSRQKDKTTGLVVKMKKKKDRQKLDIFKLKDLIPKEEKSKKDKGKKGDTPPTNELVPEENPGEAPSDSL